MGMIQIRNVPDDVHTKLKARAAGAGLSLSDYLLDEARRLADRPTWAEVLERMQSLPSPAPRPGQPTSAEIIRELRGPLPE